MEIGNNFIFDGMILYLTKEWHREQILEAHHPLTGIPVAVKFKNSVRFGHNDVQAINCYNIVIHRCLDLIGYKQMGRNYFDTSRVIKVIEYCIEILPGYETVIRLYEDQLMLCIENRFKMEEEFLKCNRNVEHFQKETDLLFKGQIIISHYNNKLYRLTRFDFEMTPMSTFQRQDGTIITLKEYFETQYNQKIIHLDQPIIVRFSVSEGKPKQPGEPPQKTYLLPELCRPTGITNSMKKDFKQMRTLSFHTRLDPDKHAWQLKLGERLVAINARELEPEKLIGRIGLGYTGNNAAWVKDVKRQGTYLTKDMVNWIVVCPNKQDNINLGFRFVQEVQSLGQIMRMKVGDPLYQMIDGISPIEYVQGVQTALNRVAGHNINMLVVLLADDNKVRYDALKKWLCTETPVSSQCILMSTLTGKPTDGGVNKNFSSIVLKILLQINCKMGGSLWKVNIPMKEGMIIGYDLYHDSTMKGKTVGACVSTINQDYTQFYSQTRPHENPTELGHNLIHFVRKALRKYFDNNNRTLPKRIFLYRDGAGDGQIPYIRDQEVSRDSFDIFNIVITRYFEVRLVREACADVLRKSGIQSDRIKLAFTVVTKKINMRIFKDVVGNGCHLRNPEPGTVIDNVITHPERFDFYMIPQYANQGTVTPVCYNVVYDDTGYSPDKHQKVNFLAFKLCHLYYNWPGTVRVPTVCQYAHKLAFLVAQSINKEVDEFLRDKLFFL
uniref:Piwi domain-containing protein n=1 Tax=Heterorhabditis bacteriophora TaxID=37862 RepID=A0A1I7XF86_HETBA